ncbi:MAG: endonuclease/exonuclease/phosphatase family protein [Gemmatimonadales bacterium]
MFLRGGTGLVDGVVALDDTTGQKRSVKGLAMIVNSRRALGALTALLAACATARNYSDPDSPRYAAAAPSAAPDADTLKVIAFNVQYALHVDRAVALLHLNANLSNPDIVLLQEMDDRGAHAFADSLGFGYVYFPASLSPATKRDFGNAILSRFPIEDAHKIILPHLGRFEHGQRAAVGATILVGTRRIRVYSVHLATMVENGPSARREQLARVLADADSFQLVVLGGDFNSGTVPEIALPRGFSWPTRHLGHTERFWGMDHILLKGISLAAGPATGLVHDNHGASDHKPVWARIVLPAETAPAPPNGAGTRQD